MSPLQAGALRRLHEEMGVPQDATAEASTAATLRQAIVRGILPPGERLRQELLAAELGVSRIPLRDAFRRLQAEGLIEIDGRRGARVTSLSVEDVAELYELRRMLELHCLRLAIRNLTPDAAAALPELGAQRDVTDAHITPGGTSRRWFYRELYGWSGRRRMVTLILQLRHELNRYHALMGVPVFPEIDARLRELIVAGDAEGATRLMRSHLRTARDTLLAALRRDGRAGARRGRRRRSRPR